MFSLFLVLQIVLFQNNFKIQNYYCQPNIALNEAHEMNSLFNISALFFFFSDSAIPVKSSRASCPWLWVFAAFCTNSTMICPINSMVGASFGNTHSTMPRTHSSRRLVELFPEN
jgi:hypothetical protein